MSRAARRVAAALIALAPLGAGAADPAHPPLPACAQQCQKLLLDGQLAEGVDVLACAKTVCLEAARRLYRDNKLEPSLAALDYIREAYRGDPAYELDRGSVLYALGRFPEALESFDAVVRVFPDTIRGGAQRGHTLVRMGRLDDAQAQFESLMAKPGIEKQYRKLDTRSYLIGNIGLVRLRKGDFVQGKADLQRALELDPGNRLADTLQRRVIPALESGKLDPEGLSKLEVAFEELALGRLDRASKDFEEVIQRWPRFAPAYLLLAEGFRANLRYAECEDLLRQAEAQLPEDLEVRLQRIRCTLLRHGVASAASKPAIAELRQIADKHPDNRLARELLAALE